jgi:hypothetical protein
MLPPCNYAFKKATSSLGLFRRRELNELNDNRAGSTVKRIFGQFWEQFLLAFAFRLGAGSQSQEESEYQGLLFLTANLTFPYNAHTGIRFFIGLYSDEGRQIEE